MFMFHVKRRRGAPAGNRLRRPRSRVSADGKSANSPFPCAHRVIPHRRSSNPRRGRAVPGANCAARHPLSAGRGPGAFHVPFSNCATWQRALPAPVGSADGHLRCAPSSSSWSYQNVNAKHSHQNSSLFTLHSSLARRRHARLPSTDSLYPSPSRAHHLPPSPRPALPPNIPPHPSPDTRYCKRYGGRYAHPG